MTVTIDLPVSEPPTLPPTTKPKAAPRCSHLTSSGRRCRLAAVDSRTKLCFRHASLLAATSHPDSEDLSADLLPEVSEFSSAEQVYTFLTRLLTAVTRGRVTPRRAAVLAYITNQLLHCHRTIAKEIADEPQEIIFDLPRPKRD